MSNPRQRCFFHVGKGGVGKSTSSALAALHLARTGRTVVLVSLDPAHNQCDIFATDLGEKPRELRPGLLAAQADTDAWMARYLRGVEDQMRRTYTYQTAFNLEKHMGIIRHSPGIEEYGLLLAFRHYRDKHPDADVIIYDMPPTALSMKFFHLPALSLLWIGELTKLRGEILKRKEIITKIQLGKATMETDKISCRLSEQQAGFRELAELFRTPETCRLHIVVNPDTLSFAEAERVHAQLSGMDIAPAGVIMNKADANCAWKHTSQLFREHEVHKLPLSETPLIGLTALDAYLDHHSGQLGFIE
ncbi:MAG: ArsA family ATPase [Pseudodesulfovibrio sp.]